VNYNTKELSKEDKSNMKLISLIKDRNIFKCY